MSGFSFIPYPTKARCCGNVDKVQTINHNYKRPHYSHLLQIVKRVTGYFVVFMVIAYLWLLRTVLLRQFRYLFPIFDFF
ncbi:MAG: hypothetical protein LBI18_01495 [Planctomycetaceae bacterium]|nr:hypothetical protein [Planctomycetaceae bacterium]